MARQEALRKRSRRWIADLMRRLNHEQRRQIYALAGSQLDFSRVPDAVWDEFERKVEREFEAVLLIIFLLSFDELRRQFPIDMMGFPIDQRRAEQSRRFAAERAKKFAKDYVENTTRWLSELSKDADRRAIDDAVKRSFGEDRNKRVAMTEGNTAIAQGEIAFGEEANERLSVSIPGDGASTAITKPAIRLVATWKHHEHRPPGHSRAKVDPCPVCSPLEGLRQPNWPSAYPKGPPAHPHCDCHLEWEIVTNEPKDSHARDGHTA